MTSTLVLARSCLRRDRATLAATALALFLFQLLLIWIAKNADLEGYFGIIARIVPEFAKRAAGFDITLVLSFG